MTAETLSVWLIGTGSLVIAMGLVFGSERPYEGVTMRGAFSTRGDRVRFAVEASGAALVAVGGTILAVVNPPSPWLLLMPVAAYGGIHTLAAWKLRQYWRYRRAEALRAASGEHATDLERSMAACASSCASWSWCLRHPFNGEYWPRLELARAAERRVASA